ncbi:hypothetical protein Igag_0792 [Ignisphaera aggregans DSM 17230]|uniref:Uncharacterized protein n=1 Tax=Ignisphaera aggregans (strain DSM 17230 / JCM 13409 / AQ1.S1) TaxID=583356 RepID=E0STK2_IGNAA|nr:hypothetical protein Igag_0792 [Ignisphaera aggregans DSM 17230]
MSSEESGGVEEVRELIEVLKRISDRLGRLLAVRGALEYIAWALWVSSLRFVDIVVEVFDLPRWIYLTYFAITIIFMVTFVESKLSQTLRLLHELQSLGYTRTRLEVWKRFTRAEMAVWSTSFLVMGVLGLLYGDLGFSTGLLIALGVGNLSTYVLLWRFTGVLMRGALYISLLLILLAPINIAFSAIKPGVEWVFTSIAIIFVYLLLALYNILAAFR